MYRILLIILLFNFTQASFANSEDYKKLKKKAFGLHLDRQFRESSELYLRLLDQFDETISEYERSSCISMVGINHLKIGEYVLADSVLQIADSLQKDLPYSTLKGEIKYFLGYANIYRQNPKALTYFNELSKIAQGKNNRNYISSLEGLGVSYIYIIGDYKKAEEYFKKIIFEIENYDYGRAKNDLVSAYYYLSSCRYDLGDVETALEYSQKVLEMRRELFGPNSYAVELAYKVMSKRYKELGQYKEAFECLNNAMEINRSRSYKSIEDVVEIYEYRADVKRESGDIEGAIEDYNRAIHFLKGNSVVNNEYLARNNFKLSKAFFEIGEYDKAFKAANTSLNFYERVFDVGQPNISNAHYQLALLFNTISQNDSAQYHIDIAIKSSMKDNERKKIIDIDEINIGSFKILPQLPHIFALKSEITSAIGRRNNSINNSIEAWKWMLMADIAIDEVRVGLNSEVSQLIQLNEYHQVYERGLQLLYYQQNVLNQSDAASKAINWINKNNNRLLQEKVLSAEAKNFSKLPDSVANSLSTVKANLRYYRKMLEDSSSFKAGFNVKDSASYYLLKYDTLKQYIKNQYNSYYEIVLSGREIDVDLLVKDLKGSDRAAFQFFEGEDDCYFTSIIGDQVYLNKTPGTIVRDIEKLLVILENPNPIDKDQFKHFNYLSHHLYDQFFTLEIERALENNKVKQIKIVPGGVFSFLPFEVLTTNANSSNSKINYNQLAYLIKDYDIYYSYNLSDTKTNAHNAKNELLAVSYSRGKNNLKGAELEIEYLQQNFDDHTILVPQVLKDSLKEAMSYFELLHIALHGYSGRGKDDNFFLLNNDTLSSRLYDYEIYDLQLNAKLAFLSSCESGRGISHRSEGVFSFARAFSYAGVPSIVSSLWKIGDKSSSEISQGFYSKIKDGNSASVALRDAKLNFLKNNGPYEAHPSFWGGLILIGDSNVIYKKEIGYWVYFLIGLIIIPFLMKRKGF